MRIALCGLTAALLSSQPYSAAAEDLTALSLEELMAIDVVSTPQFAGRIADLPASASILTADDIRAYGWRTLADALRSLRGFNVTYDRTYTFAGVRGLSPPGDYIPRLRVLIDGISTTENIYDSVLLGGEFPLDIDLIERIEIVRGPSASVFGGDAMGGIVNIITRRGSALNGAEVAVSAGSGEASNARASVGGVSGHGFEYLLSASAYDAQGERLNFPEMAALGNGTVTRNDDERRRQLFSKFSYGQWHATLLHGERRKTVATGSYGTVFNDPAHHEDDAETLAEIGHQAWLSADTTLATRLYSGRYNFDAIYPYDDPFYYHNRDRTRGKWWGSEARLQSHAWKAHLLTGGIEFERNYQQDQRNDDVGYGCIGVSNEPCLNDHRDSNKLGIYGQDEILLSAQTRLTLGLRFDRAVDRDTHWSPRLGLVQHTDSSGTFKLLYASAFREPSVYEQFGSSPQTPDNNDMLDHEQMHSLEGIWEYAIDSRTQVTATLYGYRAQHIVAPDTDGTLRNQSQLTGRGAEFELNHQYRNGTALRASYAAQYPELRGARPPNAPEHLLKLNLRSAPSVNGWSAGVETQLVSHRRTEADATIGGYATTNLNLIYHPHAQPWEVALGLYNLFDHRYSDPIATDPFMDPRVMRDRIVQDGRTWRAKLSWRY